MIWHKALICRDCKSIRRLSLLSIDALRDKYHLSERRLANLKMSKVWAICEIIIECIYALDI